jgi:uncharacterized RDD family membrane protein YckC
MRQYEWPTHPSDPGPQRYELASWGSRVGALLLDLLVLLLAGLLVGVVFGLLSGGSENAGSAAVGIAYLAFLLYAPLMLAFNDGQTLGKKAVGIAVLNQDGRPIGFGRALWREIFSRWLLGITVIGAIVDPLWPLWDRENRALHDMMASTRVIVRG